MRFVRRRMNTGYRPTVPRADEETNMTETPDMPPPEPPPIPFVPANPAVCTCVDPWSNCPTHG